MHTYIRMYYDSNPSAVSRQPTTNSIGLILPPSLPPSLLPSLLPSLPLSFPPSLLPSLPPSLKCWCPSRSSPSQLSFTSEGEPTPQGLLFSQYLPLNYQLPLQEAELCNPRHCAVIRIATYVFSQASHNVTDSLPCP